MDPGSAAHHAVSAACCAASGERNRRSSKLRRAFLGERLDAFLDLGAAHAVAGAAVGGFLVLFLWQGGNFFRRNRPGLYRPEALPAELMPKG